eukprot:7383539-Prymnesium_polylepis.1
MWCSAGEARSGERCVRVLTTDARRPACAALVAIVPGIARTGALATGQLGRVAVTASSAFLGLGGSWSAGESQWTDCASCSRCEADGN